MKVKELIGILAELDGEIEVVVDFDDDEGWFVLDGVNVKRQIINDYEYKFCNLVSSSETS